MSRAAASVSAVRLGRRDSPPLCCHGERSAYSYRGETVENLFFTGKFVPAVKGLQVTERHGYNYGR